MGLISGMTGGGGNVGAVVSQLIFFKGSKYLKETGISLMGIMIMVCTMLVTFIYFPQWGGMFVGPRAKATVEGYYASEWSSKEKEKRYHHASSKFAENSRSKKGKKGESTPLTVPVDTTPPAAHV